MTIVNQAPYLRVSRGFPLEINALAQEISKSYLEIANAVNTRTIGVFPVNRQAITGDSWFISGSNRQQTLRQVYTFTSTGNVPHGINILGISQMSPHCYGSFYDISSKQYGAIYASDVPIAGQVSFYITPNSSLSTLDGNIVIISGAGAPAISKGIIVLEWIANV